MRALDETSPSIVVIGNFDGVHSGHRSVLEALGRIASERALVPVLLTFDPHPAITLGRTAPSLLTRLARKQELVRRFCPGIQLAVREFTHAFSQQTAAEFADCVLVGELGAKAVMVGANFRFGRGRSGGIEELSALGGERGFEVLAEVLVKDEHGALSSTRVRELLTEGAVERAGQLLGRPHMVSGGVGHGQKRGRTIGFATCNFPEVNELLPANGVYAVLVDRVQNGVACALAKGVANLGVRPTIEGAGKRLLEVHLLEFAGDLYGHELRVHFVRRLREERRFAGLDDLKTQIAQDSKLARDTLVAAEPVLELGGAWA